MPLTETTKLAVLLGLLGKAEASYGAGGTLAAATDGILLAELADLDETFIFDGKRAAPPGTFGTQKRVPPAGSYLEFTAKTEVRGRGAAYGASALHPEHVLMLISGHAATITTTAGAEKIVYAPSSAASGFASGVFEGYSRGNKWNMLGAYADWTWGADGIAPLMSEWAIKALFTSVADAACPSITYPATGVDAIVAANTVFTVGGVALAIKKFQFKLNRTISQRLAQNTAGHNGFSIGRRNPTLTVTVEEPATATYDARAKRRTAVAEAIVLTVGSVQYNRDKFAAPAAQLVDVKSSAENETATLDLTFELQPSALGANDEYTRTVD